MLVGDLADDGARCGDTRRGVDGAADPGAGDLLQGLRIGKEERKHGAGQPRHEVDHGHDDDEHERDDVGELPVIAAGHARSGDARRDAADRDPGREHHGRPLVDPGPAREPESEEPNDGDDEASLQEPENARLHDVRKENGGAQADDADLDVELALDGGLQPIGQVPQIADQQPEKHREKDRLEAVIGDLRNLGDELREERDGENEDEREQESLHGAAQQPGTGVEHDEADGEKQRDVVPCDGTDEGRRHGRQLLGDEDRQQEQRNGDPDDDPVLGPEFLE